VRSEVAVGSTPWAQVDFWSRCFHFFGSRFTFLGWISASFHDRSGPNQPATLNHRFVQRGKLVVDRVSVLSCQRKGFARSGLIGKNLSCGLSRFNFLPKRKFSSHSQMPSESSMKSKFTRQILVAALAVVALVQNTSADQGNMERALDALRNARAELSQASHDKGGHRTNAIHIIDQAIEQVKEGIRVGVRHGD
jgi:hypothetical protein